MISSRSELIESLTRSGLEDRAAQIADNAKDAVRFEGKPVRNDAVIPIGASKIGGSPDLPNGSNWPDDSLSFLCQIDLAQAIGEGGLDAGFPTSGRLSLFYNAGAQVWGFDPADRSGFRLIYDDTDITRLQRIKSPQSRLPAFKPLSLSFSRIYSLMPPDSYSALSLLKTDDERDKYFEWWDKEFSDRDEEYCHQLGGWPDNVQGDMQCEAQYVSNGIYCGDEKGYAEGERRGLEKGALDWILLMQIASDESAGFMWGDMGYLYIWIRQQDLRERNFDRTWLILQCG